MHFQGDTQEDSAGEGPRTIPRRSKNLSPINELSVFDQLLIDTRDANFIRNILP
jgi:hypothetical protein